MNIFIKKERKINVPQLIVDVDGIDKMRESFIYLVKVGDIVPMYFVQISIAQTEKIIVQDEDGNDVEVVQIKKVIIQEKNIELNQLEISKILYETRSNDCCMYGKKTLSKVNITLPEFTYKDL